MKNIKVIGLIGCVMLIFFSSINGQNSQKKNSKESAGKKHLIVYLTRTENTKAVAKMIQKEVGGDLISLKLKIPYPENYKAIVKQVALENETGFLPQLKTKIENMEQYDTIFLGFPTWGMQLPPPMKSFLNQYDLTEKTLIPFNTNAGYGLGNSIETIRKSCPNSTILNPFSIKGGIERDGVLFIMDGAKKIEVNQKVIKWLKQIGY